MLSRRSLASPFRVCSLQSFSRLDNSRHSRALRAAGRNALVTCAMLPLYAYRKNSKSIAASTQLVLPDSLQLLPALTLGLLKNPIFRFNTFNFSPQGYGSSFSPTRMDTRPDERMALFANFNTIPLKAMPTLLYPNLFPLHNNQVSLPTNHSLSCGLHLPKPLFAALWPQG